MRFTAPVVALLAAAAAASANPLKTNAERMARNLPPLPPTRRTPTPVEVAPRGYPSGTPGCGGHTHCCNSLNLATDGIVGLLLGLLGIHLDINVGLCGVTCTNYTPGVGTCSHKPVCCTGTNYGNGALISACIELDIEL